MVPLVLSRRAALRESLEAEEIEVRKAGHPDLRKVLHGKEILLWQQLLKDRHVDLAFYMRGVPRVLSPFGELTDDTDTGSSTEPTHDMYEDVRNRYRDVAHSIEQRLDRRARGVISHFIVER